MESTGRIEAVSTTAVACAAIGAALIVLFLWWLLMIPVPAMVVGGQPAQPPSDAGIE